MASTTPPKWPFSIKHGGYLDGPPKVQIYEYSNNDILMIGHKGVLSMRGHDWDFTTLEDWEEEYKNYCMIMQTPFFARFKKWKSFYRWRAGIRAMKINTAKKALEGQLFIVTKVCVCLYKVIHGFISSALIT